MEIKLSAVAIAVTENIITRLIKKIMYRKRKHAMFMLDTVYTNEIVNKLSKYKNCMVVNLNSDFKEIMSVEEITKIDELKTRDINKYKLIVYPIILKFVNFVFKYYCRRFQLVFYSDDFDLINFVYGNKKILTVLPDDELVSKLENKDEITIKKGIIFKNHIDYLEYDTTNKAVEKIKEVFKLN